jgi:hypothetical protein
MAARVARAAWAPEALGVLTHAHDRFSQRLLGWLERRVLGRKIGEHRNWVLARKAP